jgi:RNA polymerase sigma-70 factor (ECF subfamily)
MPDDELDELVRAAQCGDAGALDELLVRIRPQVLRRCARFLPCRMDAEEAAQDALFAISSKIDSFDGRGSFLGWVAATTSNSARATYRSLRRRADRQVSAPDHEPVDPRTTSVIAGTRLDLMESLDELEDRHPALVEPFVLRDLDALTYDEIAELTGAPLGTVKHRIHRARAFMRERMRVVIQRDHG